MEMIELALLAARGVAIMINTKQMQQDLQGIVLFSHAAAISLLSSSKCTNKYLLLMLARPHLPPSSN
jgi:multisubunit Na+/H+ antiporter MnhC subunit